MKNSKNQNIATHYKRFQPSVFSTPPNMVSRRPQLYLFRLQTGHSRLRHHLNKLGLDASGLCETRHVPETTDHFLLLHCSRYSCHRRIIYDKTMEQGIYFSMENLFTVPEVLPVVLDFISAARRQLQIFSLHSTIHYTDSVLYLWFSIWTYFPEMLLIYVLCALQTMCLVWCCKTPTVETPSVNKLIHTYNCKTD